MQLVKITTEDTFQIWVEKTNAIIDSIEQANTVGSSTPAADTIVRSTPSGTIDEGWLPHTYLRAEGDTFQGALDFDGGIGAILSIDGSSIILKTANGNVINSSQSLVLTSNDQYSLPGIGVDFGAGNIDMVSGGTINLYTNTSGGWALRKTFSFAADGSFTADSLSATNNATIGNDLTVTRDATITRNLAVNGTITESSDKRLKENIVELDPEQCLDDICSISAVKYNKKGQPDFEELGVIAQQVQTVIPQVVRSGYDDKLSVAYSRMVPVLIGAVQELQNRIVDLQKQIDDLS